ncbi:cupin domain-containing protein [Trinickia violacea]|uniref:Cupin domain-containing protein n=1 Tax=Trinickia violacea TaxID=2571746 RepID=A0A4P8IYD3_9BURK|nr:cupin domain-containing protein [Trinickia violacea]QCP52563.1 cupin domain-containing protein [Trinickia violacea]
MKKQPEKKDKSAKEEKSAKKEKSPKKGQSTKSSPSKIQSALPYVVNVDNVREIERLNGEHWGSAWKPLTPALDSIPGRLGANLTRLPPGRTACPFHAHAREDEVFFVLSGRGVLRYGNALQEIRAGDCISCPAGMGVAHQLANPFDEDLLFFAVGLNDPHEVCTYPDTGKVMIRSLNKVARLAETPYLDGEPDTPRVLELARSIAGVSVGKSKGKNKKRKR